MSETSSSCDISTRLRKVAELARSAPEMVLTTLAHHIDVDFLREAYRLTRKDGAVGIDGQSAEEYAENLEENLHSLLDRFKTGNYRAPAVRRVHIPKGDGKRTRPIGVPTFEDKVLQRAVLMVLEAVYEQDFCDCSYGFRPARSAHDALEELWSGLMDLHGGWVVEVDIQAFFDTLDHGHLRSFFNQRVRDGVIRRTVDKWLKAGVLEEGAIVRQESGTPQGGVISPLLANAYLHEVLDKWFEEVVKPRLKGRGFLIRYADDAVMVFSHAYDARRVMDVLPKRFGRFGLSLHPEKTRLVRFERPDPRRGKVGRSGTFNFLGFTHYWGKSHSGTLTVKRKTASDRFRRSLKHITQWCRLNRHLKVSEQHSALCLKLQGHYQYYGITGNGRALQRFHQEVKRIWRKWLNRRSHRARMPWEKFSRLLERYPLSPVRIVHSSLSRAARP